MSDAVLRVALTFDAEHPDRRRCRAGVQESLVSLLADLRVRATFFLQGRWVTAYPELARAIAADGHVIGNHSHFHARMPLLSDAGLRADVTEAELAITAATGRDPRPWFRCPFGAGFDDARVLGALSDLGYRDVHWNVEAADWEEHLTGAAVRDAVFDGVRREGDGAVVLLHTWPEQTLEALPAIVTSLRESGATLVGIDDLEGGHSPAR